MNKIIKNIVLISVLSVILFLQEQILSMFANIQLTVLLLMVYSKVLKIKKTLIIIFIHVFLDNIFNSSISLLYTPAMFIGWSIIPILLNTLFKRINNIYLLSLIGFLFSIFYCFSFIIPSIILTKVSLLAYLSSDILFEIIMGLSSVLSVIWLYNRLYNLLQNLYDKYFLINAL